MALFCLVVSAVVAASGAFAPAAPRCVARGGPLLQSLATETTPAATADDLRAIPVTRAALLVGRWKTETEHLVALGHLPKHTHPDHNVPRLMGESTEFKLVWRDISALAAASKTNKAVSGFLSRARVLSTIGSSKGACLAVVLDTDASTDIIYLVKSPDVRSDAEAKGAEAHLLTELVKSESKPVRLSVRVVGSLVGSEADLGFKQGDDPAWLVAMS